jgi:CDP-paratose 2-epimerase
LIGICEERPLDFYSPYGCSKGAADQYVLDYARFTSCRQSCFA